jgi:hypothetical protein
MALFDEFQIQQLEAKQFQKRREHFKSLYRDLICDELNCLEHDIQKHKDELFEGILNDVSFIKTASVPIRTIRSFDFRSVKGKMYNTTGGSIFDGTFDGYWTPFKTFAAKHYPESFVTYLPSESEVDLYHIWRSDNFLKDLETRLALPENMYFQIRSRQIEDDQRLFQEYDIPEYENTLMLVYRFSK